jgi:hypothetical protein
VFWAASLVANIVDLHNGESGAGVGVVVASVLMLVLFYGGVHFERVARRVRALEAAAEADCENPAIGEPVTAVALDRARAQALAALLGGGALLVVFLLFRPYVADADNRPNLIGLVLGVPASTGAIYGALRLHQCGHALAVLRQHAWVHYELSVLVQSRGRNLEALTCMVEGEVVRLRSVRLRSSDVGSLNAVLVAGPSRGRWVVADLGGSPIAVAHPALTSFNRRRWRRAWGSRAAGRAVDGSGR